MKHVVAVKDEAEEERLWGGESHAGCQWEENSRAGFDQETLRTCVNLSKNRQRIFQEKTLREKPPEYGMWRHTPAVAAGAKEEAFQWEPGSPGEVRRPEDTVGREALSPEDKQRQTKQVELFDGETQLSSSAK